MWMVPVAGGAARRLTSGATPEVYPRFSPDGASIIYNTWGLGANRIYRVPRTGGPSVALTPVDGSDSEFGDISPDGHLLAFARADKGGTQVYVIPVSGGESRRLIDSESTVPRWSPDGRWLAFSRSRAFTGGVWVIGADGSGIRRLSDTGSWPVWWPGGKQLGYLDTGPDGVADLYRAVRGRASTCAHSPEIQRIEQSVRRIRRRYCFGDIELGYSLFGDLAPAASAVRASIDSQDAA